MNSVRVPSDHPLVAHLRQRIAVERLGNHIPLMVAVSGGLDSMVLLHACVQLRRPGGVTALHVNHGLHASAPIWQAAVHHQCDEWQVDCRSARVAVSPDGRGLEATARDARYSWLLQQAQATGVLLLAHHQADQSETILLNAMRAAGPRGLKGMRSVSYREGVRLVRPFLDVSQALLEAYANELSLAFHQDPSNTDEAFDRNFLRSRVLAPLRERWPLADRSFARLADIQSTTETLLTDLGCLDLERLIRVPHWSGIEGSWPALNVEQTRQLPRHRIINAFLVWCDRMSLPRPSSSRLSAVLSLLEDSQSGHVEWSGCQISRYRQTLYLTRQPRRPANRVASDVSFFSRGVIDALLNNDVDDGNRIAVSVGCPNRTLYVERTAQGTLSLGKLADHTLMLRTRHSDDRIRLAGRQHHMTLKNLFQSTGLPPWARDEWPLVCGEFGVVAVSGLASAADFAPDGPSDAVRLSIDLGWRVG